MNEIVKKQNLITRTFGYIQKNYKIFSMIIFIFLATILLFQITSQFSKNKILKSSIVYNEIKSNNSKIQFNDLVANISKDKNFYSVLAFLEDIQIKLKNNEIETAYNDYIFLLEEINYDNLYKSAIAIQAAYNFLDKINFTELKKTYSLFSSTNYYKYINEIIKFVDGSISSYEGHRLEIEYLLLITEQNYNGDMQIYDDALKIYDTIQESKNISSAIKERVKKINDFQKYK